MCIIPIIHILYNSIFLKHLVKLKHLSFFVFLMAPLSVSEGNKLMKEIKDVLIVVCPH